MNKHLDVFLDMYRFIIVMCPLNVTTEQVAKHIKTYITGTVQISDNIQGDVDTLLLYETKNTDHSMLTRENIETMDFAPKRICFIVGLETKLHELTELCECNVPLVYASFCNVESSVSIKLYPTTSLNNNIILTSPDLCESGTECKVETENYIDDGRHYNLDEAKIIHFTQPVSIGTLLSLVGTLDRTIYIYHNEYNKSKCERLIYEFEHTLEQYKEIKLVCTLYLILDSDGLMVQS